MRAEYLSLKNLLISVVLIKTDDRALCVCRQSFLFGKEGYVLRHAGSIFMGRNCPEALGDYMAGPNHTLPTSGTARFSSPLSVDDFVKKTQYTYFTREALESVARDVEYFATKEGLTAHAKSAVVRLEDEQ